VFAKLGKPASSTPQSSPSMCAVSALTLPSAAMTLGYNVGPVETGSHQELRVTVIDARGHAGPDDLRRILIHDLPHNFASLRYGASLGRPSC
jgi:hypothetical protein